MACPIEAKKREMDTNVLVGSTSRPTDDVVEDKSAQPLANGSCGISWRLTGSCSSYGWVESNQPLHGIGEVHLLEDAPKKK